LKPAPELIIDDVVREVYDMALEKPPNIKEVAKPVQAILQERGYEASARQIQVVANRPEFKRRRRAPGKTLKSEKHGPRK
jgi:hypothetical protein